MMFSKNNILIVFTALAFSIGSAGILVYHRSEARAQGVFQNTSYIKSLRLFVFTKIKSAWPTKDGGSIVSGTTDPNIMSIPPDGFVAKLDARGNVQWVKLLKTTNAAGVGNKNGEEDVQSIIELKNGGYLMASKVWGFITTAESSSGIEVNKILLTKLDRNGNMLWNKSFMASAEDTRGSLLETNDGGFLFHTSMTDLAPGKRGEDQDVTNDLPYASLKVFKFNKNGDRVWSKNITNMISRKNDSYFVQTPDGGFAVAGDLSEINPEKKPPYHFDTYPALAKFDKNFNFQWAKSLEGIPMDMAMAVPQEEGGYKMGWKKIRQPACIIHSLLITKDGGFLVMGSGPTSLSLVPNLKDMAKGNKSGLIGFKFNADGNVEWVKKMSFGFNDLALPMKDFSISATNDGNMILAGPFTWADTDTQDKIKAVNDKIAWYKTKYGELEIPKEDEQKTAESQEEWKQIKAMLNIVEGSSRPGVFMMGADQTLNVHWAKTVVPQRAATNFALQSTADHGAIVAGEYTTNVVQSIQFSMPIYFRDGFVAKVDANGNAQDDANWMTDYTGTITTEMVTPYTVSNDLKAKVKSFSLKTVNRKPTFSPFTTTKLTTYAPFSSSPNILSPTTPTVDAHDSPIQNSTNSLGIKETYLRIKYERAVPMKPVNDKSRDIHNDLMPILNRLFTNEVKLTDNMGGTMLSYIFSRVITKEDVAAIKIALEGQGYKTQDEGRYMLTMYKVGFFLNLTFQIENLSKASLDVTY